MVKRIKRDSCLFLSILYFVFYSIIWIVYCLVYKIDIIQWFVILCYELMLIFSVIFFMSYLLYPQETNKQEPNKKQN
jgi:hypothetical protein